MIIKRNKNYLLYRFLALHFFLIILALLGKLKYENAFIIWIVTVVLPNLIFLALKNLISIDVNEDFIQLNFSVWFLKKHVEVYKYDNLIFTHKNEFEGKARDVKFRIYKKGSDKSVISIGGLVDGFYDDQIKEIIQELNKKGIEVKTK